MTGTRTREVLDALSRPLRRLSLVGWVLGVAATAAVVLAVQAWGLRTDTIRSSLTIVVSWALIGMVAVAAAALGWRERKRLAVQAVARYLEGSGAHRRGALTALLESPATGTSRELTDAADTAAAAALAAEGARGLVAVRRRLHRRGVLVTAVLVSGASALASAGPGDPRVAGLWSPGLALERLFSPVTLVAEPALVPRGGEVALRIEAVGHRTATLWQRAPGESWSSVTLVLDSDGRARRVIGPVDSDLFFHASAGRRSSDTVAVRVRLAAFLGGLQVEARYPAYLQLEPEPISLGPDSLLLPAGTTLVTRGEASTTLRAARWEGAAARADLEVAGRGFTGAFAPPASGTYRLVLEASDGTPLAIEPVLLPVNLVPDRPPVVEVPVPGADTVAPVALRLPLIVDARDDHGLTGLELVAWTGRPETARARALPVPGAGSDRALVETVLPLTDWALEAGDTLHYFLRATDNSPTGQSGRSREYIVIVPTGADDRRARQEAAAEARGQLDSLLAASRRLERQTEDLAQARNRPGGSARESALGFEDARRAEAVAQDQDALLQEAEALQETLEALREAAERGESPDTALARRLAEISAQLERALSPELRERLAALQQALADLDPEGTREALRRLAEVQQTLRQALERSRQLFERAALEGELATLASEAGELAGEQEAWNQQVTTADTGRAAATERQLAARADSLAGALARAADQVQASAARQDLAQAADRASRAAQQMRQAAGAAGQAQRQAAQRQGQQAAAEMDAVSREAASARERQQDSWRQEVLDALDRAMAETAELSRQQLEVNTAFRHGRDVPAARGRQALVEESAQQLIGQVAAASGKHALVPPQIAVALAVARSRMTAAREAVSTGSPNLREAAEASGEAVDALAVAVYQMIRARDDVSGAASGSGLAEAMERMTQLAQQQGQVSQQAGSLLPMMGVSGVQQQLQSLAAQQRVLAQQMDRIRAQGQLPGTRELSQEARDLAARLEAGRLDRETVERQERLFRRMLDAGRSLQGEERDDQKERKSEAAEPGTALMPPGSRRGGTGPAVRPPSWEQLQTLSPEERRLVIEYFRRLAGGGAP